MKPLSLRLRSDTPGRIDMSPVTPERLQGLGHDAIGNIFLQCARQRLRLRELFQISGRDPGVIEIHRATPRLFRLGNQMRSGRVLVRGDCGDELGIGMHGGEIHVHGNAGDGMGTSMRGGRIIVQGDAGAGVGAPAPGQLHGMMQGHIQIHGCAGERVGERMRGGMIVVLGDTGAFTACRMIAGTIVVMGNAGVHPGLGMRRGTLVLGRRPRNFPPGFRSAGALKMEFLRLLFRELGTGSPMLSRFRRFGPEAIRVAGDLSVGGKGELLILLGASSVVAT